MFKVLRVCLRKLVHPGRVQLIHLFGIVWYLLPLLGVVGEVSAKLSLRAGFSGMKGNLRYSEFVSRSW